MGAAEMFLDLERLSRATRDCVGTVGVVRAFPGAVHTIPGEVEFYVDIRGVDKQAKQELVGAFREGHGGTGHETRSHVVGRDVHRRAPRTLYPLGHRCA